MQWKRKKIMNTNNEKVNLYESDFEANESDEDQDCVLNGLL